MKANEKKCPRCAEAIKKDALVCRYCGYEFSSKEITAQQNLDAKQGMLGCGIAALIFLVIAVASFGGGGSSSTDNSSETSSAPSAADLAAQKIQAEKDRQFKCLSAWDGSHRGIVDALKRSLRNPDSFKHIDTRITPPDQKGNQMLVMEYRAQNGFGGMNVGKLAAVVHSKDCSFEIVATIANRFAPERLALPQSGSSSLAWRTSPAR